MPEEDKKFWKGEMWREFRDYTPVMWRGSMYQAGPLTSSKKLVWNHGFNHNLPFFYVCLCIFARALLPEMLIIVYSGTFLMIRTMASR